MAEELLGAGALARAVPALEAAERACLPPDEHLRDERARALAELGRTGEAESVSSRSPAVVAEIARNRPRAPADESARTSLLEALDAAAEAQFRGDSAASRALHERVWEAWHPLGVASLGAGLAALAAGDRPAARRRLDRALVELEGELPRGAEQGRGRTSVEPCWPERNRLSFSVDGSRFAAVCVGLGRTTVFRTADQRPLVTLDTECRAVAFGPAGRHLACTSDAGGRPRVQVRHALTGRVVAEQDVPELAGAAAFSPRGDRLALGGRAPLILSLDGGERARLDSAARGRGYVEVLAWSDDGRLLAMGTDAGRVEIWDTTSRTLRWADEIHHERVRALQFVADGQSLASGASGSPSFAERRVSTGRVFVLRTEPAADVAIAAHATRVALLTGNGIELFRPDGGTAQVVTPTPEWNPSTFAFVSEAGDALATSCLERGVCVFEVAKAPRAEPRLLLGVPDGPIELVQATKLGNAILMTGPDGILLVWDLRTGTLRSRPVERYCRVGSPCGPHHHRTRPGPTEAELAPLTRWPRGLVADATTQQPRYPNEFLSMTADGSGLRFRSYQGEVALDLRTLLTRSEPDEPPRFERMDLSCAPSRWSGGAGDALRCLPEDWAAPAEVRLRGKSGAEVTLVPVLGLRAGLVRGGGHFEVLGEDAADARHRLFCFVGRAAYPLEVCEDRLGEPGLLARVLRSGGASPRVAASPLERPPR